MKRFLFLLGLSAAIQTSAQTINTTIIYERKQNLHRTINNDQMKAMTPEFRTSKQQLLINDTSSLYKNVPEDEAPDPFANNGGTSFRFKMPEVITYKNFNQGMLVEARELMDKKFLISDSIKTQAWKLVDETKTIMGHVCKKAIVKMPQMQVSRIVTTTTTSDGNASKTDTTINKTPGAAPKLIEVVAWYADDIAVPAGPESYGGLPGAILALDVDNGLTTFVATEIKQGTDASVFKQPAKGKKVTRDEFKKESMDMLKSMNMGGGGNIRVF
ncbi:MAG: GLPGLI family protein [Filimonas sp.]|nr:GLPGLI family protein [Filimonas sp.]